MKVLSPLDMGVMSYIYIIPNKCRKHVSIGPSVANPSSMIEVSIAELHEVALAQLSRLCQISPLNYGQILHLLGLLVLFQLCGNCLFVNGKMMVLVPLTNQLHIHLISCVGIYWVPIPFFWGAPTGQVKLVGGFNLSEKYARQIGWFPHGSGWK